MSNSKSSDFLALSLMSIVFIFVLLWGIGAFSMYNGYNNMNMGYGYHMNGVQMWPQNGMMGYNNFNGMNMQGGMNGNMQGVPNQMNWVMDGMGTMGRMNGYMQNGMGAMGGMNRYMQGGMNGNMGW